MRRADLRLAPAAAGAWLASAVAIGMPGQPVWLCVPAWIGAAGAVVLAVRCGRGRSAVAAAPALVALTLVAIAVVLTSVAAGSARRAPPDLVEAAEHSRPVTLGLVVIARPAAGRVRAETPGGSPVLVFGVPGDPAIDGGGIGDAFLVTGVPRRAEPGDAVAFLLFAREPVRSRQPAEGALAVAADLRERFATVAADLPGRGGALLPGLSIGDTSAVPPVLDADMKASSLSHLTAVSGSNCAVVVGLVFALAAVAGLGRVARILAALLGLAGFVLLVTPEPSVLRAAVMAAVALLALASSRPAGGVPVLCLAVLGLLIADPWLARSYGFALSVLATAGLVVLAGPIADRLGGVLPRWLALVVAIPLAAQLACQPVLLLLDPALPVYGVLANALAEPAAPVATVLGLVACLLASFAPPLAVPVAWIAWAPSSWIAAVAGFAAGLPGARSPWPAGPVGVALLVVVSALIVVLVLPSGPAGLRRVARGVLVIALTGYLGSLAVGRIATELARPADWQFALCDVGQGDAILIRDAGVVALVDTGPEPDALAACLDELGIGRIDLLVLTHYDHDHVGGVETVLGRVSRALIGPAADARDAALADALRAGGATVDQVARGEHGVLGALGWRVLWPPPDGVEPGNAASVTLLVEPGAGCRCLSGLLLGDLGEESQLRLLGALRASGGVPVVDVVKVAHHGSADQAAELYDAVDAAVGLIGVGAGNDYGHPTERLLAVLAAAGTTPERTDLDGMVLLAPGTAPGEVRVWTEHGGRADRPVGAGP